MPRFKIILLLVLLFVCLRLYILVNNFSVILGQLPGFNQHLAIGMKCLAQGHNTAPQVRIVSSSKEDEF